MTGISAREIAAAVGIHPPTPEQARIIEHPPGPGLVVAGAGSGKTETMAARVVWLVANAHVAPDRVLGLTFTRKAAAELAARVSARLAALRAAGLLAGTEPADPVAATPTVSTYHAYAARLVREHALRVGREPESRLLSEAAAWQFASEVVAAYDGPLDEIGKAESTITNAVVDLAAEMAEHLVTPEALAEWLDAVDERFGAIEASGRPLLTDSKAMRADLRGRRLLVPVLRAYDRLKRDRGALDFADQMSLAADLARRFPIVGEIERERFGAVLLDEFQDTSHAQLQLLTALFAGDGHCVSAVGDPHQSIYAWRGASAATLAQFPAAFGAGPGDVLPLSTSWRNARAVLDVANAVAAPLRRSAQVPVAALAPSPGAAAGRVEIARLTTIEEEAEEVAAWVAAQRRGGAASAAVLCRKRSQFGPILDALAAAGLPYEVVGLGGLLMTPEVQDVVAALSVAHDAARGDRLMRLLTGPIARLGAADLDRFHAWARATQSPADRRGPGSRGSDLSDAAADRVSLVEALVALDAFDAPERAATGISVVGRQRLRELATAVEHVRRHSGLGLPELVDETERALGLDVEILSRAHFEPAAARAHLDAFADVAAGFAMSSDRPSLGGFLAWLDAALEEERGLDRGQVEIAPGAVHVLTVHAAKGLEWDAVAIPGLVEAGFPAHTSTTSSWDPDAQAWRVGEPSDGAWTKGLATLPYDLRGDRDSLPGLDWRSAGDAKELDDRRKAFRAAAGARGIEEERRLAYVALTRARHRMLLSAAVWGSQGSPRVVSRFLGEAIDACPDVVHRRTWVPDPEPGSANPRLAAPLAALWPPPRSVPEPLRRGAAQVDAAMRALARPAAGAGAERALDPRLAVLLAERRARADGLALPAAPARHRSAADLVALAEDPQAFAEHVRRPMPQPPSPTTRRGTAFHAWVERHYRRAALLEPDDLPGSADPDHDDQAELAEMIARFRASPWVGREPLEVEVSVETVVAGTAVRGRIDAVFPRGDGGVVIVDWKTGRPPADPGRARARAIQLAAYRLAYARLRGLHPVDDIDAVFYYAGTGETVQPPTIGEDELVRLVRLGQRGL